MVFLTSLPPLTVIIICVFFSTFLPAAVPCEITVPSDTVSEFCTTARYPSPTSLSALIASSFVIPSTFGTVTLFLSSEAVLVCSSVLVVCVLELSLLDLVLPTSLTIINIVTISIITAIPTPIIFIIRSSLSLFSSSISESSSSSSNSSPASSSSSASSSESSRKSSSDNTSSA